MGQINNVRVRREEGTGNQEEWININGGGSKKVDLPKGIDVKNRISILDQMDDNSNIVRYREIGANDIEDSQVRDLGTDLSHIRKFRTRKRVVMCSPREDIDFIKNKLEERMGLRLLSFI